MVERIDLLERPYENLSIREIVKFLKHFFVRFEIERKFFCEIQKILFRELVISEIRREISERSLPKFILLPEEEIVLKSSAPRVTSRFPILEIRWSRKHYLRDRYEFTSTRADLDLDPEARVEGWDGDRCGTIPYISGGRFMEIRSAVSSRYNDRWPRYDRAVAPVPYVSLGVPPSTTYARPRRVRICGSLAGAPLNMEESGEITIRRVRSGLRTRISLSCKLLSLRGLLSLPV